MKKAILLILFIGSLAVSLSAQQLTRFAVVDLSKVYSAFCRDSSAVRGFENRSKKVQAEIDKMTKEIQDLKSRHADVVLAGDQTQALRLEADINRKSEFMREYYTLKTAELEEQRRKLSTSGSFLEQVHNEIRFIAESEGFSMVLNLSENTRAILWYSPTVDITDKVIQGLLNKAKR
jgi:outer membrane protein